MHWGRIIIICAMASWLAAVMSHNRCSCIVVIIDQPSIINASSSYIPLSRPSSRVLGAIFKLILIFANVQLSFKSANGFSTLRHNHFSASCHSITTKATSSQLCTVR